MKKIDENKWYFKNWFIFSLIALWPMMIASPALIIVPLAGVILASKRDKARKEYQLELDAKYGSIDSLDDSINSLELEYKEKLEHTENEFQIFIDKINRKKKKELNNLEELKKDYDLYSSKLLRDVIDGFDYENITSEEINNEIALLKVEEKDLIDADKAVIFTEEPRTKRVRNNNIRQILRTFEAETHNIISNVTVKNIDSSRNKIVRSFEVINNMFKTSGFELSNEMLEIKLQELNFTYNYDLKNEQEKEIQRAIKEQMIEEERVKKEIEEEKKRIEKEENQFNNEVKKLLDYLQKTDDSTEKNFYMEKIKELEEKLALLEKDKENVFDREANTRAGFVYIISNIGSFGENIYKIGMTRRLEPMDRVKELSSASVPFEFDVHAMIFSEDAPALENMLHKEFEGHEVNKVNPRKEFYNVSLEDIKNVVEDKYSSTVKFTMLPKAEEYYKTLELEAS